MRTIQPSVYPSINLSILPLSDYTAASSIIYHSLSLCDVHLCAEVFQLLIEHVMELLIDLCVDQFVLFLTTEFLHMRNNDK